MADVAVGVGIAIVKVAVFAALMLVLGVRVVPRLLEWVEGTGSRELFTLSVLAVAIGIAAAAYALFGVSFALGAFLAGVVLNESPVSHRAAEDALPMRDAFAVLFFVSVGMLLDPSYLVEQPMAVVLVTLLSSSRSRSRRSRSWRCCGDPCALELTVAAGLAQVGEFSFILATLGLALGLIPDDAFQLVVAAALVSITLNPFVFGLVEPFERRIALRPGLVRLLQGAPAAD